MTGFEVAGWFASAFVGKLADQVRSYIGDQYEYQNTNIKDKLESLEGNMNKIQAAIHAADQRHIENPGLKKWLLDLKDACYDAEDVLDLFEYQLLKDKGREKSQVSRILARFLFSDNDLNELLKVVDRFDKLVNQMKYFLHLLSLDHAARDKEGERSEIMEWRSTDSDFKEPQLFGRDTEKTQLIELLQEKGGDEVGPSRKLHVLPVVGTGGVGKTTLAQSVYNEQKKYFNLTAWVCVSDKWELRRLMVEIIESANIKKPRDFYHIKSLDKIRQILKKGLIGKKFLLVLDDVWNEDPHKWEKMHTVLQSGNDGSKVIVTTRSHKIADMMGTKKVISLGGLADNEYLQFFVHCAFGDVRSENHPNLIILAEKIVKKLGGLPLAAKVIGGVLKSYLKEQHWNEILESKWWQVDRSKDQIMPVLRLSYDYLPAHLKQCFVYCSLFPKGYRFSVRKLVWLWMAQGYIQDIEENTMENIGDAYFKELLSRSFFEEVDELFKVDDNKYVIHDLLHDLAQYLSHRETFIVDDYMSDIKPVDIPKKVRHIYTSANNLHVVCNGKYAKKNLRSLVVSGNCDISQDILKELKGLRVLLILHGVIPWSLPKCFQKMLHLRYLEIIGGNGCPPVLKKSLGKLYHLQVLALKDDVSLYSMPRDCSYSLPKEINSLIKLRHLYAPTGEIGGIGTLTSLQELNFFVKKEKGFEIWQVRDMSQLRELFLKNLENVESKKEASKAKLCSKRNLKKLRLHWGPGSHTDHCGVLEGLEPPQNLQHLEIHGYNGERPSWWNGNGLSYLNRIEWYSFSSWEILPPFGQLPFLRYLCLSEMTAVKRIGPEFYGSNNTKPFPSLEALTLYQMSELVEWCNPEGEDIQLFPRLSYLGVKRCPKLRGPLCLPSHLKELHVTDTSDDSGEKGIYLSGCPDISRAIEWIPMQNLASMERVDISFEEITSFTTEQVEWFQRLTSLQSLSFHHCSELQSLTSILSLSTLCELSVWDCPSLQSLPEEGLPSSLTKLHLWECPSLQSLPEQGLPSSLTKLHLWDCPSLQSLPEQGLPSSLTKLHLWDCPSLRSLPEQGLPSSLTKLHLSGISQELKERCREDGLDWHKISHIPNIIFD